MRLHSNTTIPWMRWLSWRNRQTTHSQMTCKMVVLFVGIFGSSYVLHAGLPPEFKATYEIKKGFLKIGEASRSLTKNANGWVYESVSKTVGFASVIFPQRLIQETHFNFTNDKIILNEYRYRLSGRKKKRVKQQFDWQNKKVHSQVDKKKYTYEIPADALDQNVYQLNLMLDLAHGIKEMHYNIAENKRLKVYPINHIRNEKIDTSIGKVDTVVIMHKGDKSQTTLWCASSLAYLPLKIYYKDKSSSFTAYVTSIDGMKEMQRVK